MSSPYNPKTVELLKQVLAQEDTVLFIGSGISLWAGLPTWSGMIDQLAQFVERSGGTADLIRAESKRGDLLQAASYGFDKLTKSQIGDFVRAACCYGRAKPHEIHRKIVSLGPRCFITTNYDDLIEQSLRTWQPDRFYRPPITNRQLTDTAEIVHARAVDFIFKPHGDAADSESIILTREQYRQLLPQGERHAALESLKMLLASRPVFYLGFGLRDPDFIYVRDLLANTYKGGTRDHYALMADVSEQESDYWRRHYGIHLLSYPTTERADKSKDHSSLLTLLDTLLERVPTAVASPAFDPKDATVRLALARHAAALGRIPKLNPELPIRVNSEMPRGDRVRDVVNRFDHCPIETFLASGPERAVLVGLPGAGKTYSIRQAAARLAERLQETCLAEAFDDSAIIVPILADLKLYRGDLNQLINQTLPSSLPLHELIRSFKVKVFLDSFNEMPREFWESGSYESDFQRFIKALGRASLVIGSRTPDGLAKLEFPAYCLDQIDESAVTGELERRGINLAGRFSSEVRRLLQRPFYFQYVASGAITLPSEAHPRDFYKCLFKNASDAFTSRFGSMFDLERVLSIVAYDALNRGEEAFPTADLLSMLNSTIDTMGSAKISPSEIANWLVSISMLVPYSGSRVAFVHQSVTEYLAAAELARRYLCDAKSLKGKLTLTRWDQALFLTLSLLPSKQADVFLQDVIKTDFTLALNAVKYLEIGRDEVIAKLLSEVPKRTRHDQRLNWAIAAVIENNLPITEQHVPQLRKIVKCGNSLGGAAVVRLVSIKGAIEKPEILHMLLSMRSDFNFCRNGVAPALQPFATDEDVKKIAIWADEIQAEITDDTEDDATSGFISGASVFLAKIDLSVIRRELFPSNEYETVPSIRTKLLCSILEEHHSTAALNMAGELLMKGVNEAATAIYFISSFGDFVGDLSWDSFTSAHVTRLERIIVDEDEDDSWGLDALKCLCAARPDIGELVKQRAMTKLGADRAILLYCVSPTDLTPIFQLLDGVVELSDEERAKLPLSTLTRIDFDWTGREQLFVRLLKLRDTRLASVLFGDTSPPTVPNLGDLDIGAIDWWLEWMLELSRTDEGHWFLMQLGGLFADHLNQSIRYEFVAEFNKQNSKFRQLLLHFIIPQFRDINTDIFNEATVSFLLADLSRKGSVSSWNGHLLGSTATERFITERILPLVPSAKSPLKENLKTVLRQAGPRHGRRYGTG